MIARRNALRLGVVASAVALSGRSTARAADALSIGPNGVNIDNLQVAKSLTVAGNAELKTPAGANTLDIQSAVRVNEANHPKGLALYVTANGSGADSLAEFRHSNGSQGIGIGYNTIYATGSNGDQELSLKAKGNSPVQIQSDLMVSGDATLQKNLRVAGPMKIDGNNALEFGAGVSGKEVSAGQIAYQKHSTDALDIVGAGTTSGSRKIKCWAEGGATLYGSLTVTGNVGIGTLSVPGGVEPLRMLRGIVNSDGTKFGGGEGFVPTKAGTGLYDITFTPSFPSVPAASATQIYGFATVGNAPAASRGGDTRDNAVIAHLSADGMRVKTGDGNGNESARVFSFIVIGPR